MSDKKFYLTTPIYYVNARPHIGHAYTTIVADVIARRHRLLGEDTYLLTGTDEHGQKIERSAAAAGIAPQQFADQVSKSFEDLWKRMGITYDVYIRTTDPKHKRGAQKLFAELYDRGFIYLASYTGQYCVSDEAFVDVAPGEPCPDCGRPTETLTEENFFFKLSEFGERIATLIESNELLITPDSRRNEVLSFVKGGLNDLSISRSSFTWGIPVPEPAASTAAQKHIIYVWLDALTNYMTAIGYGGDDPAEQAKFEKYWPADLHLVGKEIIRFHCVYWPAFLLAAGLPLPKAVTAHGWLLFDDSKMSKSKGNIVRTETILDAFGTLCPPKPLIPATNSVILSGARSAESKDPEGAGRATTAGTLSTENPTKAERDLFASDVLRYFLLREIPFGQDGSFSFDALITRYNADLANGYGNLVSRTLTMIDKYCNGKVPSCRYTFGVQDIGFQDSYMPEFFDGIDRIEGDYQQAAIWRESFFAASNNFNFSSSLELIQQLISRVDVFLSEARPWKLDGEDEEERNKRNDILYAAADALTIITCALHPYIPTATAKVWRQLGFEQTIESLPQRFDGVNEYRPTLLDLRNFRWNNLKPGTQLGPLAPIFPRADKGLAQIMTDMENPTPLEPEAEQTSTHPAAAPRTTSIAEPTGALPVGGSTAHTTGPDSTPSHTEIPASGIFANQPAPATDPQPTTPQITIDDFAKVELRVAQVLVAERIPKADKLLRLEVDLGPDFPRRQILSGIAEWYTPEELIGRRIVVVTNLAPRKMRGLESHGMLLAASHGEDGKPVLATFAEDIAMGSRLK